VSQPLRHRLRLVVRSRHLAPLRRLVLDARRPADAGRLGRWAASPVAPGSVALVGDSLAAEFAPEHLTPIGAPLLIRGWPGETIAELSARVGETLEREPSVLILQTGTNDALRGRPLEVMVSRYESLLATCRRALPAATIAALSLPPIAAYRLDPRRVTTFNEALRRQAPEYGVLFVDTFAVLADARGEPLPGISRDGVHLTGRAYQAVASLLRESDVLPMLGEVREFR
jgi:lysophospholipase L1-like esterase